MVPCHLFAAYLIESAAAEETQVAIGRTKRMQENGKSSDSRGNENQVFISSWHLIAFAHAVNASFCLIIASAVVYYQIHHPGNSSGRQYTYITHGCNSGIGTLCELHAVIVWLKCCSYALTCRDLRHAYLSSTKTPIPKIYASCPYPRNITLGNLCYFWWAPTLVYQPAYPRTERIRWSFVALRILELAGLSIAIWIASAQYATPLLQNSLPIISQLDVPQILERLMKLSSISLFCWLAGFYALFQSALNALAEIMRFADRDFYRDWWNSKNIRTYWTSWNRPVYHFMKRHIFIPLVARGCPPLIAQVLVFVFSGILHEMLVGIPTHNILGTCDPCFPPISSDSINTPVIHLTNRPHFSIKTGVAFAGMMFQLPLIFLTDLLSRFPGMTGPVIGNCTFWISFVLVGQPLAALLYFFAWQAKYGSTSIPSLELKWDWRFGRG